MCMRTRYIIMLALARMAAKEEEEEWHQLRSLDPPPPPLPFLSFGVMVIMKSQPAPMVDSAGRYTDEEWLFTPRFFLQALICMTKPGSVCIKVKSVQPKLLSFSNQTKAGNILQWGFFENYK